MSNPESVEGPGEFYNLNVNVEIDALRGTKVAAFREACLEKLSPYLNSESRGWAYFDTAYQCAITNDTKLVEIILLTSPVRDTDSSTTPYIKIVTNEMYTYEAVEQCLSEDIVVVLNDEAQYLVDAGILAGTEVPFKDQESNAQIFVVEGDNKLGFLSFNPLIPTLLITDVANRLDGVAPFGFLNNGQDIEYAIDRGWEILKLVQDEYPRFTSLPNS